MNNSTNDLLAHSQVSLMTAFDRPACRSTAQIAPLEEWYGDGANVMIGLLIDEPDFRAGNITLSWVASEGDYAQEEGKHCEVLAEMARFARESPNPVITGLELPLVLHRELGAWVVDRVPEVGNQYRDVVIRSLSKSHQQLLECVSEATGVPTDEIPIGFHTFTLARTEPLHTMAAQLMATPTSRGVPAWSASKLFEVLGSLGDFWALDDQPEFPVNRLPKGWRPEAS